MNEINKMLIENPQHIINILNRLEFYKVRRQGSYIFCGNTPNGKGKSISINLKKDLVSKDFKHGQSGGFISFLMKKRKLEFVDVINIIKQELNIESFHYIKEDSNKIFGGIYSKIQQHNSDKIIYQKLDNSVLEPYKNKYNTRFLEDGITFDAQKAFHIGFDVATQRITVPWWDYEGNLMGIMGRYNGDEEHISKWLPIIQFPKLDAIYGYSTNYEFLEECEDLYVFESEKSTMQAYIMDIRNCVSLGRNEISSMQIKRLIWLRPKRIIYCLDEGLDEEVSIKNAKATKQLVKHLDIKVGYVHDDTNTFLPSGSKASPTDLGKEVFMNLIKYKVKEV